MSTWGRGKITHYGLAAANKKLKLITNEMHCALCKCDRLEDMATYVLSL